jgi:hypothetical protein
LNLPRNVAVTGPAKAENRQISLYFSLISGNDARDWFAQHCDLSQPPSPLLPVSGHFENVRLFRELARRYAVSAADDLAFLSCNLMRAIIYEAAHIPLVRSVKWSWLKAWAMNIARRRGLKKAIVPLARRLAVIMHRIWVDGTEFRWIREEAAAA